MLPLLNYTKPLNKRYKLGPIVGKGATAIVYKAIDINTGVVFALKQLPIDEYNRGENSPIQSEIQLLSTLRHPSIIQYIESFAEVVGGTEYFFIVLEYAEGGSLISMINKFGPLPETLAATYLRGVLQGLRFLHRQGIVHRDIKGANVLMDKGAVRLADFGIATDRNIGDDGRFCGTPYYMAPEVIMGAASAADSKCDVWSFGCLAIELVTGQPPHYKLNSNAALYATAQGETDIPPVGTNNDSGSSIFISSTLDRFLRRCFVFDPAERADVDELLEHPFIKDNNGDETKELKPEELKTRLKMVISTVVEEESNFSISDIEISSSTDPTEMVPTHRDIKEYEESNDDPQLELEVPADKLTLRILTSVHNSSDEIEVESFSTDSDQLLRTDNADDFIRKYLQHLMEGDGSILVDLLVLLRNNIYPICIQSFRIHLGMNILYEFVSQLDLEDAHDLENFLTALDIIDYILTTNKDHYEEDKQYFIDLVFLLNFYTIFNKALHVFDTTGISRDVTDRFLKTLINIYNAVLDSNVTMDKQLVLQSLETIISMFLKCKKGSVSRTLLQSLIFRILKENMSLFKLNLIKQLSTTHICKYILKAVLDLLTVGMTEPYFNQVESDNTDSDSFSLNVSSLSDEEDLTVNLRLSPVQKQQDYNAIHLYYELLGKFYNNDKVTKTNCITQETIQLLLAIIAKEQPLDFNLVQLVKNVVDMLFIQKETLKDTDLHVVVRFLLTQKYETDNGQCLLYAMYSIYTMAFMCPKILIKEHVLDFLQNVIMSPQRDRSRQDYRIVRTIAFDAAVLLMTKDNKAVSKMVDFIVYLLKSINIRECDDADTFVNTNNLGLIKILNVLVSLVGQGKIKTKTLVENASVFYDIIMTKCVPFSYGNVCINVAKLSVGIPVLGQYLSGFNDLIEHLIGVIKTTNMFDQNGCLLLLKILIGYNKALLQSPVFCIPQLLLSLKSSPSVQIQGTVAGMMNVFGLRDS